MNRFLLVSILSCCLAMGAADLRAENNVKPAADTAATNKVAVAGKAQTMCPVMKDNPVNKALFVDVQGKRIYVCCKGCMASIKKNPVKYIQQMEAEGIVLEAAPVAPEKP